MQRTLLELVQSIASSISSDEINTLGDSPESLEIAEIVRCVYEELWERTDLPESYTVVNLVASGDSTKPVLMTVPTTVTKIKWIKYNSETTEYTDLYMLPLVPLPQEEFFHRMHQLDETGDNIDTFAYTLRGHTFTVMYENDRAPTCYTALADNSVLFDAFDNTVDDTLQASKTFAYAKQRLPWATEDTFVPDLSDNQFPLLLAEAKSTAWAELRQTPNQKVEQSAKRGWTRLQRTKDRAFQISDYDKLPNYGRK
jgi:hypothetical protein